MTSFRIVAGYFYLILGSKESNVIYPQFHCSASENIRGLLPSHREAWNSETTFSCPLAAGEEQPGPERSGPFPTAGLLGSCEQMTVQLWGLLHPSLHRGRVAQAALVLLCFADTAFLTNCRSVAALRQASLSVCHSPAALIFN